MPGAALAATVIQANAVSTGEVLDTGMPCAW